MLKSSYCLGFAYSQPSFYEQVVKKAFICNRIHSTALWSESHPIGSSPRKRWSPGETSPKRSGAWCPLCVRFKEKSLLLGSPRRGKKLLKGFLLYHKILSFQFLLLKQPVWKQFPKLKSFSSYLLSDIFCQIIKGWASSLRCWEGVWCLPRAGSIQGPGGEGDVRTVCAKCQLTLILKCDWAAPASGCSQDRCTKPIPLGCAWSHSPVKMDCVNFCCC